MTLLPVPPAWGSRLTFPFLFAVESPAGLKVREVLSQGIIIFAFLEGSKEDSCLL